MRPEQDGRNTSPVSLSCAPYTQEKDEALAALVKGINKFYKLFSYFNEYFEERAKKTMSRKGVRKPRKVLPGIHISLRIRTKQVLVYLSL